MVAPTAIPATAPVDRLELSLVSVSVGSEVGSSVAEVVVLVGLAPLVCVFVPVVVDGSSLGTVTLKACELATASTVPPAA